QAAGLVHVVHVPKTIDNDLDLPHGIPTFGFQTARHVAVEIVKNLMVDARTTSRWYFAVTMGRKAGHLALGIGKAAGATLTVIPEEFGERHVRLQRLLDHVERDEHGHLRLADVDIGDVLRREVTKGMKAFGLVTSIVAKNVGYELR